MEMFQQERAKEKKGRIIDFINFHRHMCQVLDLQSICLATFVAIVL